MTINREVSGACFRDDGGKDLGRHHLVDFQKARPGRVNLGNVGECRLGGGVSDTQSGEVDAVVYHVFAIEERARVPDVGCVATCAAQGVDDRQ